MKTRRRVAGWRALALVGILVARAPAAYAQTAEGASPHSLGDPAARQYQRIVEAVRLIKSEYVDVVDASQQLAHCAGAMEQSLAGHGYRAVAPSGGSPTASQLDRVADLLQRAEGLHLDAPGFEKIGDDCLRALAQSLDSHSAYLDQSEYRELQVGAGQLAGIGVELSLEDSNPKIVSTIEHSPAERGDLREGDILLSIDGASVSGLQLRDVVKLLRGAPGSTIVLQLARRGEPSPIRRELTREIIRVDPVKARTFDDGLLYLRVTRFDVTTLRRFVGAIRAESDPRPGRVAGVILDLRANPGGMLQSCIAIAGVFLPAGSLIVQTRGRSPESSQRHVAGEYDSYDRYHLVDLLPPEIKSWPLVVLVDHASAACSEILAAALQDHKRAKVVGHKTFGYGTVQAIMPFGSNAAFKLTIGRFYRPAGGAMDSDPVVPDVAVDVPKEFRDFGAEGDLALLSARQLLEQELSH